MFGPLFGRYPLWFFIVRTRKRPLNIRTLDGRLREARLQKFVSRKTSRILKVKPKRCEGAGRGKEELGTGWGDQPRISCQEGSNFLMYSDPLKKRSRENNHQQLLLTCLTFKKPLTESTIHYFFEFEQICFVTCFHLVGQHLRIVSLNKFTNFRVKLTS